eukprot:5317001-Amphidinium_carterae.1
MRCLENRLLIPMEVVRQHYSEDVDGLVVQLWGCHRLSGPPAFQGQPHEDCPHQPASPWAHLQGFQSSRGMLTC